LSFRFPIRLFFSGCPLLAAVWASHSSFVEDSVLVVVVRRSWSRRPFLQSLIPFPVIPNSLPFWRRHLGRVLDASPPPPPLRLAEDVFPTAMFPPRGRRNFSPVPIFFIILTTFPSCFSVISLLVQRISFFPRIELEGKEASRSVWHLAVKQH